MKGEDDVRMESGGDDSGVLHEGSTSHELVVHSLPKHSDGSLMTGVVTIVDQKRRRVEPLPENCDVMNSMDCNQALSKNLLPTGSSVSQARQTQ